MNKLSSFLFGLTFSLALTSSVCGQTPLPVKQFLSSPEMRGASFSFLAKDVHTGEILYGYDQDRSLSPASVMKLVTTATALELLGEDFRFETKIEYDGEVENGILHGNLYIHGGGDPTLGSSFFAEDRNAYRPDNNTFLPQWIDALTKAGIRKINGDVISDESIFDNEGVSRKWVYEDLGSYYGMGCYGISVFDNQYRLVLRTGKPGDKPTIQYITPAIEGMHFNNYLTTANVSSDSSYIMGMPFAKERYLYGTVPAGKDGFVLKGDLPDPALFMAEYVTAGLMKVGLEVTGHPSCFRILNQKGGFPSGERKSLCTTYSPALYEIAGVTNEVSHNLYADALLKTIGLSYPVQNDEIISSFDRGVNVLLKHWQDKGLDTSTLKLYDGSGLAVTDKLTAGFICDVLTYMKTTSLVGESYITGIPRAGKEGSVRNFLKGTHLEGKARLKSGSMTGVKSYAGYIEKDGRIVAVALIVNSYAGDGRPVTKAIEKLLLSLF